MIPITGMFVFISLSVQLVHDLCLSGCLKPKPQDRRLGLANQPLPNS